MIIEAASTARYFVQSLAERAAFVDGTREGFHLHVSAACWAFDASGFFAEMHAVFGSRGWPIRKVRFVEKWAWFIAQ